MKARLLRDIVIRAGTVFDASPWRTRRYGDGHVCCNVGLTKDTSGDFEYCIEVGDPELSKWFEVL